MKNNMIYKIKSLEKKVTATGKNMIKATLIDPQGVETGGVAIWDTFPNFSSLNVNSEVIGDIKVTTNGQYTNITLNPEKTHTSTLRDYSKGTGMKVAQERKAEMITKSQENKELGIKISSTIRMAVDIAIAEKGQSEMVAFEDRIKYWRQWLWLEWQKEDKDFKPF